MTRPARTTRPERGRRSILVVETGAHRRSGHYPVMFAELAHALEQLDCDVHVLTRQGWALEDDPLSPRLRLHRFGRVAAALVSLADQVQHLPPGALGKRLADLLRTVVTVAQARRLRRRLGCDDVIVTAHVDEPSVGALLAGHGRWILCQFRAPRALLGRSGAGDAASHRRALERDIDRMCAAVATRRRRHGSHARIVTNGAGLQRRWAAAMPWLDPVSIPFIAARELTPIPGARAKLGLAEHDHLALFFGMHGAKDADTVWEAFAQLPEWRLVVAGTSAADAYRAWARDAHDAEPSTRPILLDGFVDETTRQLLHLAADVIVISFKPGFEGDSGVFVDAVAAGRSVVCSDACPTAELVERFGLGQTFEQGSPEALRSAIGAVHGAPDPEGLRRARAELSPERLAQSMLDALRSPSP